MHNMRWSELEYVLAVANNGSAAAAARALKVNHATVLRRVRGVENRLNIRIFEHLRTGYRLTPEGEVFLDAARSIEETVAELDRKIAGGDIALRGTLSITTTDSIFPVVASDVAAFRQAYPEVIVDLSITNARLDLDSRDSDIAIRASNDPPPHLVGRRICSMRFGVYAVPELIAAADAATPAAWSWIGMEAPLSGTKFGAWLSETVPAGRFVMRSNSFIGLRDLAVQGVGHAILPRHLGDPVPELARVEVGIEDVAVGIWLLSHRDVLRSRRVRVGTDFLYDALKARTEAFEGR